ncbi:ester cyclase [Enterococcus pingfangensis]|uniref:ester cyclase n=1 Tax=Enterococcus pingfangensis TaxID=2559924 RepID=UPI001484CA85
MRITHRIWEERAIGVINETYHNNTIVHSCSALNSGVLPVIAGTLSALHAFPDRRVVAESVVWSEDTPGDFFTSHRSKSNATNLGDSEFGKVTGRKIQFRAIADCKIVDNRIYEEWLVRDNIWLVQQLGLDPYQVANELAKKYVAAGSPAFHGNFGLPEMMEGQFYPEAYKANDESVGELMREIHSQIFQCKMIDKVKDYFLPQALVHFIGNKNLVGKEEIQGTIISFLASFPNAYFMIDRITCNERAVSGEWDVAVRWKMKGLHEGKGMFGDPSGNSVNIMGINHYHVQNNQIREAWIMFDGIDVLRQIVTLKEENEIAEELVK